MAPELIPLAAPVPLPSWFEWAKLIVPPIITGLVVLAGAYITYHFANRGRKEDILYKERYKGFEELVGYTYTLDRFFDNVVKELNCYTHGEKTPESFNTYVEQVIIDLRKIVDSRPNDKNLVLQSEHSKKLYSRVLTKTLSISHHLDFIYEKTKDNSDNMLLTHHCTYLSKDLINIRTEFYLFQSITLDTLDLPLPKR